MFCTGSGVGSLHGWAIAAAHTFLAGAPSLPPPLTRKGKGPRSPVWLQAMPLPGTT